MRSTDSVQDYLKAIYSLAQSGEEVTTSAIAARVGVSPASVTAMVKRLADAGHLTHRRYQGVALTESGTKLALEVIRHHRLLETYLHQALGLDWDRVHQEAEILEHALSEELEDLIAEKLGHPSHDPHGDPIPPKNGRHVERLHPSLSQATPGTAKIERVSDQSPEALRYLSQIGLVPGAEITVEVPDPFGGAVWVSVQGERHGLGRDLAEMIYVSRRKSA